MAGTDYKSCPLKKRPIVYINEEEHQQEQAIALTKSKFDNQEEQPQDLSLKRKARDDFGVYAVPSKREYVLNLSKAYEPAYKGHEYEYRPVSPVAFITPELCRSTAMLSPRDSPLEYQPADIHLRGLTADTTGYTTNPYQSAFVMAAGCNPMTALWSSYQPNFNGVYPSPASSIISINSPCSAYSYHQITPPSSPGSDASFEPEDLSVRNDIPLPALYHLFDEAPCSESSSSISGAHANGGGSNSGHAAAKNYRFKCDKCNKMYSTSMGLSKHQQFHCPAAECNQEKKQHACHECGKLYTTVGALKMHIRTHTLPCKCPICGKAFSRPWLLQGHIRTHTGEKPFQCPDCPRSFADRSNLRAHQQTHVEVKKYACKVCNKSFSRMSLLNKHASSNCTITIT